MTILIREYKTHCDEMNVHPNKAVIRSFDEPAPGARTISWIFRGNYKLNFNNRLRDNDVIILSKLLEKHVELIDHIDLSYNQITEIGAKALAKLIEKIPNLMSLNLQGNQIDIAGAKEVALSVRKNQTLEYINVSENNIQNEGALQLTEILFESKMLKELNLAENKISHDGIAGIMSVLNWNNYTLEVLNIDAAYYSTIGQEIAIHIAKMLQTNKGITRLSLRKNALNCDGIYVITEHLLDNKLLRSLDLSANKISFKGCEAIGKFLIGENCMLESLNLSGNKTGHYGAKAIALALSKNRTLIHLDMTRNDIDDDGLRMLGESLYENGNLTSVKLYWNNFGQGSLRVFHDLKYNFVRDEDYQVQYYFDFDTYLVDGHLEMCYVDNNIPYEVAVSKPYFDTKN
jgi:Ran GTPase-activating protein (RanGAP) involved in mRNA processing and transport